MKPEDKLLLLKDLCARLPYGVKCFHPYGVGELDSIDVEDYGIDVTFKTHDDNYYSIEECKPYLRPMSSMTEEERKQLSEYIFSEKGRRYFIIQSNGILYNGIDNLCFIGLGDDTIDRLLDWLNEHNFDYRGLIEKGLALEAPNDMYKET